ncbi:MAG: hypothetical protein WC332_01020 [Clostridia bacterium]|jgi:hypothetical protein
MEKNKNMILRGIPEELHYEFAILSRQLRTSMKQLILQLMERAVNEHKGKGGKENE